MSLASRGREIRLVDAFNGSSIRSSWLGMAGLRPSWLDLTVVSQVRRGYARPPWAGAINLPLGVADAQTDSAPLVGISAQGDQIAFTRSLTKSLTWWVCSSRRPNGRRRRSLLPPFRNGSQGFQGSADGAARRGLPRCAGGYRGHARPIKCQAAFVECRS